MHCITKGVKVKMSFPAPHPLSCLKYRRFRRHWKQQNNKLYNQHITKSRWIWLICYFALFVLVSPTNPISLAVKVRSKYTIIPFIYNKIENIWLFVKFEAKCLGKTFGFVHSSCCFDALIWICVPSTTYLWGSVTCNMFNRHSKEKYICIDLVWRTNVTKHHWNHMPP